MADYLVTATLKATSNLPEDDVTNNFALHSDAAVDWDNAPDGELQRVAEFYTDLSSNGSSISSMLSSALSRTASACTLDVYDITGKLLNVQQADGSLRPPPHGSPIFSMPFSLGAEAPGAPQWPTEVAIVATLRAQLWDQVQIEAPDDADPGNAVNRPRQRRSGRLYVGPVNGQMSTTVSGERRVHPDGITIILDACTHLKTRLLEVGIKWCVWSRMDGVLREITRAEVDNAFDIQRSRGRAATVRTAAAMPV